MKIVIRGIGARGADFPNLGRQTGQNIARERVYWEYIDGAIITTCDKLIFSSIVIARDDRR